MSAAHRPGAAEARAWLSGRGSADDADRAPALLRREIVVLATTVVALTRLADGVGIWVLGILTGLFVVIGARRVIGLRSVGEIPPECALLPGIVAFGGVAVLQLVPLGVALVPTAVGVGLLIELAVALEVRIAARPLGFTPFDRLLLLALSILVAFVGFTGVAVLVPDALVEPALSPGASPAAPALGSLLALAGADALIAFLLGFRFASLRAPHPGLAVRTAVTYAAAIAIAAGLLSAAALPRLLGPALLTLVFFLWETLAGAEPPTRRDPRFLWQVGLLASLAAVVIAWNLALRG